MSSFKNNLAHDIDEFGDIFDSIIKSNNVSNALIVCGKSFYKLDISKFIDKYSYKNSITFDKFSSFLPNPKFDDIKKGVSVFLNKRYDIIIAIGGGSAIDVAKCIKIFSNHDNISNYKDSSKLKNVNIPLLAIPTTAGTGSETTQFAVMHDNGVKISVDCNYILPNYYILYPLLLKNLPIYQKKSTILDSMFQAIESYWSLKSNNQSKEYSLQALELLLNNDNYKNYILNSSFKDFDDIMQASYFSGKAINITRTTAPHAMSYKLSKMFNIPHGISVAHCFTQVFDFTINNIDKCIDNRGVEYFRNIMDDLVKIFNAKNYKELSQKFNDIIYNIYEIEKLKSLDKSSDLNLLISSINTERLNNNPIKLLDNDIRYIYNNVLE